MCVDNCETKIMNNETRICLSSVVDCKLYYTESSYTYCVSDCPEEKPINSSS